MELTSQNFFLSFLFIRIFSLSQNRVEALVVTSTHQVMDGFQGLGIGIIQIFLLTFFNGIFFSTERSTFQSREFRNSHLHIF